ncbi:MAG: protein phosphatase 2C domain-containing protein, partial [Gammaproteobacteria bacterium]|nr:protein phosphatase 2C domain-containing protein [Gammaproteobacteria bacterium]
ECLGMGATVVAVTFGSDGFTVMHLGDSRLYRLRAGKLFQLTEDHSVVQEFIRQGVLTPEEARLSINKNLVTRALGIEENPEPEFTDGDLSKGDLYLLCSDGLTDVVQDEEIQKILAAEKDLEAAAGALIDAANEGGGPDNITVVLARVSG